jgi:large subunit ribosomal protein L29
MSKLLKAADIRSLDVEALNAKLAELKDDLFQKKLDQGLNRLENSSALRTIRREIAMVNTVITEKVQGTR